MLFLGRISLALLVASCTAHAGTQIQSPRSLLYAGKLEKPNLFQLECHGLFQRVAFAFIADWGLPLDGQRGTLIQILEDPALKPEQYTLRIAEKITIKASTPVGAAWGLSTLAAMLQGDKWASAFIADEPYVPFRAVSLDLARRYHSPSTLRTLIRWCHLAKIRTIQLHLTDDQSWMLPTEVLKGIDKHNAHGRPAYTRQELAELQSFAEARGVALIPEIDMPGHSSLLIRHDPELFQIRGSESKGCVNFGSTQVRAKLKKLLSEVYTLFPKAHFIHLGGDEAWYPNAEKDPQMAAAAQALGQPIKEVFVDFISEMAEHVIASGRTPIVWEGFHASDFAKRRIPRKTLIVAWEGPYYPAKQLVPDGFNVINAGWDPHYVVNHYPYDLNTLVPLERLLNSSYLNFGIVSWSRKEDSGFRFQKEAAVKGSLMCWWEGHEWNAQTILPPRILAFGASLWSPRRPSYDSLVASWKQLEAGMESPRLGFNVTVSGVTTTSDRQFTDKATLEFTTNRRGLRFAVRTDGQPPSLSDLIRGNTFQATNSINLAVQAFSGQKPVGETLFVPMKKVSIQRSLTTGCRVSAAGSRDPQFSTENLVDGISDDPTGYWLAYPCPQAATIDLGAVKPVTQIQVVTQWQNNAPSSYKVEGSSNGKTWSLLVDRSGNKTPSSDKGYTDAVQGTRVRYLRLTALGGELHPGSTMSRILELRAN